MNFNSIRSKVILLFIPLIVVPLILIGVGGGVYYQSVLKQNVWNSELAQARSTSDYVDTYMSSSILYLESYSTRVIILADLENNSPYIDTSLLHQEYSSGYNSLFVVNNSGMVVSNYPGASVVVQNFSDRPYVEQVFSTSKPVVIGPIMNETGVPTLYVGVPIKNETGTFLGVMVGELDPRVLADKILATPVTSSEEIYVVNSTGHIIVDKNSSYMSNIQDFSSAQSVQNVLQGKEGVIESYNPIERDNRLSAYAPINDLGWGVVVATPTSIAYAAMYNTLWAIAGIILFLLLLSLALAYLFSKSIIDPILRLYKAAKAISNHGEYKQYLSLKRKDEIGGLAAYIDGMAERLNEDRERIIEERNRSELYLDIMGHDINNLNQSVLGNLELISENANLTEDERESIEKSLIATRSSAGIINNVRSLQKIAEEKPSHELLDINDLILECIKEAPSPQDKKVTINYMPRKGLLIRCVPLLKEVFCNLINNSIKHSGPDVTVDIETGETTLCDKKYYTVSVSDKGPGIPDEVKPKIFNRFERGTTKAHGKGLGLYIVKSILEKCDGSVKVEDRVFGDPSKGVKFTVTIPASEDNDGKV
jgi:signal transduction histidine kinase